MTVAKRVSIRTDTAVGGANRPITRIRRADSEAADALSGPLTPHERRRKPGAEAEGRSIHSSRPVSFGTFFGVFLSTSYSSTA